MSDGAVIPAILLTVAAFLFGSILFGSQQPQQTEVRAAQPTQSVEKKVKRVKITNEATNMKAIKKAFELDGGWNK